MQYLALIKYPQTYILIVSWQNKIKNKIKAININPLSWEERLHLAYATSLLNP
jgi:hypothetical protein